MAFTWFNSRYEMEKIGEYTADYTFNAFQTGQQFPPYNHRERLSKYKRLKKLFQGKQYEVYERAATLLKDSPFAKQLEQLYIAVNLADILVTKPADLLVGEPPSFESGLPDDSEQQKALNSYVEENDLVKLIHESCIGNGYRGDAWFKVRWGYRYDYSEVLARGGSMPDGVSMESIVEHVNAEFVFPELSRGNVKSFKAVNICTVEYVIDGKTERPFLNVERHIPGYIIYERYQLFEFEGGLDTNWGYPLHCYLIGEKVSTGREEDIVETGVPYLLVQHIPYKSVDDDWEGIGGLEKLESLLAAINDRIVQIDYILWKHSDPTAYGPDLDTGIDGKSLSFGGKYIPVTREDVAPGYMTWNGQLAEAFKELEVLISLVFQISETPQWLFGSVLGQSSGGTGTSHTDSASIKARFLPILSKVNRIRTQYDKAVRDALYMCQLIEIANGDASFEAVYPKICWQDGIPKNEMEEAQIMALRTGNKPNLDVKSAIKRMDSVDDQKADEIIRRIGEDEKNANGFVSPSIFNGSSANNNNNGGA